MVNIMLEIKTNSLDRYLIELQAFFLAKTVKKICYPLTATQRNSFCGYCC